MILCGGREEGVRNPKFQMERVASPKTSKEERFRGRIKNPDEDVGKGEVIGWISKITANFANSTNGKNA
jgi:hypothetical protein